MYIFSHIKIFKFSSQTIKRNKRSQAFKRYLRMYIRQKTNVHFYFYWKQWTLLMACVCVLLFAFTFLDWREKTRLIFSFVRKRSLGRPRVIFETKGIGRRKVLGCRFNLILNHFIRDIIFWTLYTNYIISHEFHNCEIWRNSSRFDIDCLKTRFNVQTS